MDLFAITQAIVRKERELYELRSVLSRARAAAQLPAGEFVVLRCRLQGILVAVAAAQAREVVQMAELTPLPGAPPWLAGLLTIGAERIAVLDLAAGEAVTARTRDPSEYVVLLDTPKIGLIVDEIVDLVSIDDAQIFRPDSELPFGPHVIGVVSVGGESVLLLSAAALSVDDLVGEGAP